MAVNQYIKETIHCAGPGCEHVRQQCNHWFVVRITSYTNGNAFHCGPVLNSMVLEAGDRPVCGQACAQKLFEQWMQKASGEQSKGSDKP